MQVIKRLQILNKDIISLNITSLMCGASREFVQYVKESGCGREAKL